MWPGVEPVRGQYNQTYLDIVAEIVEEASSYGIYTLADMHEDVLSERFWYGHDDQSSRFGALARADD